MLDERKCDTMYLEVLTVTWWKEEFGRITTSEETFYNGSSRQGNVVAVLERLFCFSINPIVPGGPPSLSQNSTQ